MLTIVSTLILSFAAAVVLTPIVREFARRRGIVDRPDSERKLHATDTPLCGGVAVFLGTIIAIGVVLLAYTALGDPFGVAGRAAELVPLACAALVILVVGLFDDVYHLRGRQKLAGQLIAVAILVGAGLRIDDVDVLGWHLDLEFLAIPFTVMWLLGAINSLNLLDGADGFATTVGLVISAALAAIWLKLGHQTEAIVACSMTGALLGFLIFNFPPSSIFLGDAGSMLIGLVVGTLAVGVNTKEAASIALAAPFALLAVPILDSTAAILRRTLTGRGLAIGDRAHLHHAMMRRGFGPRRLVLAAALLSAITASGALASVATGNQWYAWGSVAGLAAVLITSRIFGFNELRLVTSRVQAFGHSLIPTIPEDGNSVRQRKVGLVDSSHCDELWKALTDFARYHRLSRVRLDLSGSWMDDGHDVLWEGINPQATVENWQTSVPIFAGERSFGKVEIAGTVSGSSGQHILTSLAELLDSLTPCIDRLIDDSARQGVVLHTGIANRVLFVNRSYWPDCEATGQLLTELCEDLASKFDVSVLAGQPNHIVENESYRKSGVQRRNAVEIYRVRHFRFAKRSMFGKACNLLSFLAAASWQAFFIPKHQVVVCETDPFLLALLGGLLKKLRGSQLVIYVQDVYPDVALGIGKVREGLVTKLVGNLLRRAYLSADRIVVLGEDMRKRLIGQGVPEPKVVCIPNWIDTDVVYPIKHDNHFRVMHGINDKFVVMHSGNMGLTQQLDQLVDIADRMRDRKDILFLLVGDGAARSGLEEAAKQRRLRNIRFLPYQSRENLALSLSAADLHVVSMHPEIGGCLVPSKMYGIMASGTPVLGIVPQDTDVHNLIEQEQLGFSIQPGDIDELETTILRCADGLVDLDEMGVRARKLAETRFDRRHSVALFGALLGDFMEDREPTEPQPSGATPHSRLVTAR